MKYILCLLAFFALAGCESPSIHRINVKIEHDKDVDPKVARHVALAVLKDHAYETKIHVSKASDEWKINCGKFLSEKEKGLTCDIEYRAFGEFEYREMALYGIKESCGIDGICEYRVTVSGYYSE